MRKFVVHLQRYWRRPLPGRLHCERITMVTMTNLDTPGECVTFPSRELYGLSRFEQIAAILESRNSLHGEFTIKAYHDLGGELELKVAEFNAIANLL